jgi:hypothetical protein
VKLAIDSVVVGFRLGALVKSDRKLVFIDCKLVLKASRCCLRGFWDQTTGFEVIATIMLRIYGVKCAEM